MRFDWTVNMGEVIAAGVLFLGFVSAHIQNIRKLQDIETRLGLIYDWWKTHVLNSRREE